MSTIVGLDRNNPLRSYLVTYSQLNHRIFPTRCSFGAAVVEAFGANNVDYFVASKEPHEMSSGTYHYHVAIRLTKTMRWNSAKQYLKEHYNVICNFASSSEMYVGAYRYATKTDKNFFVGNVLSKHPNLELISQTYARAIQANNTFRNNNKKRRAKTDTEEEPAKKKNRSKLKWDLALFIVENKVRSEVELITVATERRDLGDRSLYDYLIGMKRKDREDFVEEAWRFENAKQIIADEDVDVVKTLHDYADTECKCNGLWLWCAKDILLKNDIEYSEFREALFACLKKGRQKHVNILLVGPSNCAKTFLLKPIIELVPNVFSNLSGSTFGWMGVKKSQRNIF